MTEIGRNIAIRRKELNMTQEELAKKMGYKSKSTINKIELGVNDIPQSKIVLFAEVLETTPGKLMGWEKVQKNNDTISSIVVRLRTDADFLSLVETLNELDQGKILGVKQMLSAFLK
jgi:transcriptional regulator with XRE-family HTH domain